MSRLVQPVSRDRLTRYESKAGGASRDEYLARVAKYVPSEAVGVYASLDGVLNFQPNRDYIPPGLLTPWYPAIVFGIGLVLAFIWVWVAGKKSGNPTWRIQAIIAIVAFTIWAYATRGSFFVSNPNLDTFAQLVLGQPQFYNANGAMVALILFSSLIAFYEPKADDA